MPSYTKLFNSIITSTIWTEDDKTRIMWITMLAMADKNGEVHGSIPGMARLAGMTIEEAKKSMQKLAAPDEYSRTPDFDGRRIAPIDGGWELLNHAKYRLMASREDAKAASAARVKKFRDRNASVTLCNANVTLPLHIAEAEAEAEAEKKKTPPNPPRGELQFPSDFSDARKDAFRLWSQYKREKGQGYKPTGWKSLLAKFGHLTDEQLAAAISHSMANNYAGIFEPQTQDRVDQPTKSKPKTLPANWREIAQEIYGHPVTCSEDDLTADQRGDIYRQARA